MNINKDWEKIKYHFKKTGFIFPSSEIYGGLANAYDYGPLGILLINNIKNLWWQEFITKEPQNYGIDAKVLLNPLVWKASGHLDNFIDPLVENKVNNKRYRADHIIEQFDSTLNVSNMSNKDIEKFLQTNIKQYDGSKTDWSEVKNFNLMFETYQGIVEGHKHQIYLRPELAQGIFINYKNVMDAMRTKIPFGIGQIGKSFRNEVTPRNFTFRTREFEQMELEYFVNPNNDEKAFNYYENKIKKFLKLIGILESSIRFRLHQQNELAHYAKKTIDVEFNFPFGWGEIIGLANRGDYDLNAHSKKANFLYKDPYNGEVFIPYVIEPSIGVDRLCLAILLDSYKEETIGDKERVVLQIDPKIAPYKLAVLPLLKQKHQQKSQEIFNFLIQQNISVTYDENGSIGKRYRRQDEIGTPLCMTIDDQTLKNDEITLRYRDTMQQITIKYVEFSKYLKF